MAYSLNVETLWCFRTFKGTISITLHSFNMVYHARRKFIAAGSGIAAGGALFLTLHLLEVKFVISVSVGVLAALLLGNMINVIMAESYCSNPW